MTEFKGRGEIQYNSQTKYPRTGFVDEFFFIVWSCFWYIRGKDVTTGRNPQGER